MADKKPDANEKETKPDAEEQPQAEATDKTDKQPVDDTANQLAAANEREAKAKQELEASQQVNSAQAKQISELQANVAQMQKDARTVRFTEMAKGWPGETAKHVGLLEFISQNSEQGEASEEFKNYCTAQQAAAAQLRESGLLKTIGSDANQVSDSAKDEVMTKARALRDKDPKLSLNDSIQRVMADDPALFARYSQETAVRV